MYHSATILIPVGKLNFVAQLPKMGGQAAGDGNAAVSSPGTTDGNDQLAFALPLVQWNRKGQQFF